MIELFYVGEIVASWCEVGLWYIWEMVWVERMLRCTELINADNVKKYTCVKQGGQECWESQVVVLVSLSTHRTVSVTVGLVVVCA